jgi:hypothetical protein
MDSPQICHRCKNLDLDSIFACADYGNNLRGVPVAELHGLSRSCRNAQCALCRFLAQSSTLMDRAEIGGTFHLRAFSYATKMGLDGPAHNSSRKIPPREMVLCLVPGPPVELPGHDFAGGCDLILPLRTLQIRDENLSIGGRQVDAEKVDYVSVRSWLDYCCQHHTASCPLTPRTLSDLRVIDCQNGQVIPIPENCQYLALSYCIGISASNRKSHWQLNAAMKRFPNVIADAMILTLKLSFQYLWVDQYSINQDDSAEMQKCISNMHKIYSEAFAVIVSLGDSQSDGLPGVSSVRRKLQPTFSSARNVYVSTMDSVSVATHKSKYVTRGWTYQESLLAKRLIIFAPQQVHLVCKSSSVSESFWFMRRATSDPYFVSSTRSDPFTPEILNTVGVNGWSFGEHLFTYTQRQFTFESDVLNAYYGVLAQCEHNTYLGTPLILGHSNNQIAESNKPIPPSLSLAFASGLSWSTTYNDDQGIYDYKWALTPTGEEAFKRPGFPSWSWAACRSYKSPLSYKMPCSRAEELIDRDAGELQDAGDIQIFFQNNGGGQTLVDEVVDFTSGSRVLQGEYYFIHIESIVAQLYLRKVEIAEDTGLAKLCIDIDLLQSLAKLVVEDGLPSKQPVLEPGSRGQLEDGRLLVEFDRPPTTRDGYYLTLLDKEFEGIVLFQRNSDYAGEDDEYCVLLVEEYGDHYERFGLVWIESEHFERLPQARKRVKLG